jgi:hypothetical protein
MMHKLALLALCMTASTVSGIAPTKFAAISLLETPSRDLRVRLGSPSKHPANPLFVQDKPWETRLDNGYPNIIPPVDGKPYQLWYGNHPFDGTKHRMVLQYANSTDGIHWEKPDLGIFNFGAAGFPNYKKYGSANNIVVEGDGIGVYYDPHDPDPTRRYKGIGDACWLSPTLAFNGGTCENLYAPAPGSDTKPQTRPRFHGLIASSADGLLWPPKTHVRNVSWPPPQKWDTHQNVFFDDTSQTYVVTTRSVPEEPTGLERETSLTRSTGPSYDFDFTKAPPVIVRGNLSHQTYAQVTFPWLNVYLGLVMVYDQGPVPAKPWPEGLVHCRLTYASKPEGPWQPVEGANVIEAPDFLPLGGPKAFDSHVIFAAARPFRQGAGAAATEHIYYMGGNGPHSGPRNSSFALATLRPDGWASVHGQGSFTTPSLTVTGAMLTATVDFGASSSAGSGALRIGVLPDGATEPPIEFSLKNSVPLTANATDVPMHWHGRYSLVSLLGKAVKLQVNLEGDAMLYALGFAGP